MQPLVLPGQLAILRVQDIHLIIMNVMNEDDDNLPSSSLLSSLCVNLVHFVLLPPKLWSSSPQSKTYEA